MQAPSRLTAAILARSERGEDAHQAEDAEDLFNQLGG